MVFCRRKLIYKFREEIYRFREFRVDRFLGVVLVAVSFGFFFVCRKEGLNFLFLEERGVYLFFRGFIF